MLVGLQESMPTSKKVGVTATPLGQSHLLSESSSRSILFVAQLSFWSNTVEVRSRSHGSANIDIEHLRVYIFGNQKSA